jgi:hypothetical protein
MRWLARIRGWSKPRETNRYPTADSFVVGKQRFAAHEQDILGRVRGSKMRNVRSMQKELSFTSPARCTAVIAIRIGDIANDQATFVEFESEHSLDGEVGVEFS